MRYRLPAGTKPLSPQKVARFRRYFAAGRCKISCIVFSGLDAAPWQQTTNLWKDLILAENGPDFYN